MIRTRREAIGKLDLVRAAAVLVTLKLAKFPKRTLRGGRFCGRAMVNRIAWPGRRSMRMPFRIRPRSRAAPRVDAAMLLIMRRG